MKLFFRDARRRLRWAWAARSRCSAAICCDSRISIANASIAPSAAPGRFFASLAEIRRQAICERKVAGIRAACRKGKILLDRDASKNRQRSGCEWALGTSTPPCCQWWSRQGSRSTPEKWPAAWPILLGADWRVVTAASHHTGFRRGLLPREKILGCFRRIVRSRVLEIRASRLAKLSARSGSSSVKGSPVIMA
jgi:hypothetical protein